MPQALILAAGKGSRLGLDKHKALAEVSEGQSMLGRIATQLSGLGYDLVIVTGYRCGEFKREFGAIATLVHNPWYGSRGSMFSLLLGAQRCEAKKLLVGYCDAVVSGNVLEALAEAEPEAAAVVPGYDGRGIRPWVRGGMIVETSEADAPDAGGITFSGFAVRSRTELLKLAVHLGVHKLGASHSLKGCRALVVKGGWAVNVNTPADLEFARGKIAKN